MIPSFIAASDVGVSGRILTPTLRFAKAGSISRKNSNLASTVSSVSPGSPKFCDIT